MGAFKLLYNNALLREIREQKICNNIATPMISFILFIYSLNVFKCLLMSVFGLFCPFWFHCEAADARVVSTDKGISTTAMLSLPPCLS